MHESCLLDPANQTEISPIGEFERFSLAGFIDVQSVAPPGSDLHAPSRVIDLKVVEVSHDQGYVRLEWTAVGDDYDVGNGEFIDNNNHMTDLS